MSKDLLLNYMVLNIFTRQHNRCVEKEKKRTKKYMERYLLHITTVGLRCDVDKLEGDYTYTMRFFSKKLFCFAFLGSLSLQIP